MATISAANEAELDQNLEILTGFYPLVGAAEVVGLIGVGLILSWTLFYNQGLGFSDPSIEFNWHPFFMSLGFIFLMGNSIMIYRILRGLPKMTLKIIHICIHATVFVLVALALIAIIDSHNRMGVSNLYSVHSWIGLCTIILFVFQVFMGFITYFSPGFTLSFRGSFLPYHVFLGNAILVLAISSAISGINEAAIFHIKGYSAFPLPGIIMNLASIFFVLFGILVTYITTNIFFKRYPRPADTY